VHERQRSAVADTGEVCGLDGDGKTSIGVVRADGEIEM